MIMPKYFLPFGALRYWGSSVKDRRKWWFLLSLAPRAGGGNHNDCFVDKYNKYLSIWRFRHIPWNISNFICDEYNTVGCCIVTYTHSYCSIFNYLCTTLTILFHIDVSNSSWSRTSTQSYEMVIAVAAISTYTWPKIRAAQPLLCTSYTVSENLDEIFTNRHCRKQSQ